MPIPKKEDGPKVMQTSYVLLLVLLVPNPQQNPKFRNSTLFFSLFLSLCLSLHTFRGSSKILYIHTRHSLAFWYFFHGYKRPR